MKTIEETYSEFEKLLEEERVYERNVCFADVCHMLHVVPGALNEYLLKELGMTGDEVLLKYRLKV